MQRRVSPFFVSAISGFMLLIGSARAGPDDATLAFRDCARVVVASLQEAIEGQDPLALECAIERARSTANASASELEFAEIIRQGMTLPAREFVAIADDWLSRNGRAQEEWRRAVMWSASAAHEWLLDYARAAELARQAVELDKAAPNVIRQTRMDSLAVVEILASAGRLEMSGALDEIAEANIDRYGFWSFKMLINGRKNAALIDSGASVSLISRDAAKRAGLEYLSSAAELGFDGVRKPIPYSRSRRVEIGEMVVTNAIFQSAPTIPTPGIDAILGAQFLLKNGAIAWDRQARTIYFGDAARASIQCLHRTGRLARVGPGSFLIEVEVNAQPTLLIPDTGGQPIIFMPRLERYVPEAKSTPGGEGYMALGGPLRKREFETVRNLDIDLAGAKVKLKRAPGYKIDRYSTRLGPIGTLGVGQLRQLNLFAIDFDAMTYVASNEGCPA